MLKHIKLTEIALNVRWRPSTKFIEIAYSHPTILRDLDSKSVFESVFCDFDLAEHMSLTSLAPLTFHVSFSPIILLEVVPESVFVFF
jgi:hypothetical protein